MKIIVKVTELDVEKARKLFIEDEMEYRDVEDIIEIIKLSTLGFAKEYSEVIINKIADDEITFYDDLVFVSEDGTETTV